MVDQSAAPDELCTFTQRVLEKVRFGSNVEISKEILLDAKIDRTADWASRRLLLQMHGYLWGEKIGEQECQWPADWWQHFKQRWFPTWALRRWPVQMTKRRFVARAIYPDYKAIWPDQRIVMAMFPGVSLMKR